MHLSIFDEGLIEEQADFRIDNLIAAIATSNYIQPDHQSRFLHSVVIDGNDQRNCVWAMVEMNTEIEISSSE